MKVASLLLLFIYATIHASAQKPGADIDVLHYRFNVELSDSTDDISGRAVIRFKTLREITSTTFDLIKLNAQRKGMTVTGVLSNNQPISYTHDKDLLKITLPQKTAANTESEVEIVYHGVPADGLIIANNKYKHRGFFADHWPDRARHWLPCVDHPADKASVEFIITAPEHFQVVANGIQVEETSGLNGKKLTHYKETTPLPSKVMVIGVADFAVQLAGTVDCIPVYSWIYPEDKEKGFYDYGQATEILPFFIKNVGPYGYKKLANVQSKTRFGGLENAGAIFYYEGSVTGTRRTEPLLAHEIAHQWFGNMATEKEWAHVWLSEGFATYMAHLYLENVYGRDTMVSMLKKDRQQIIAFSKTNNRPVVDSSVTDIMQLLNANSYQKGGWILHMLRTQLGDSAFWRSIRTYYARYAGKNASTEDLQKVFEEISGSDLGPFFRQWLYTPGQPQLELSWKYDATKKVATLTLTQMQATPFQFPLEIQVHGGAEDGVITKSLPVKEKITTINIPLLEKPSRILLDPNVKLLHEGVVKG
jgi:aminopeptidase N